ncbi:hypothetical protein LvStA_02233 [Burkholderia gladioli]|nr:hypothetical protein LvStA_02233 [Burkholderia gladioli]
MVPRGGFGRWFMGVFWPGWAPANTEPSNPPQTPLSQRINGLSPFPCVLICVLKPQSHRSYPPANMGCRSWQTSRGTLLRSDHPRRVRAPQRCPDRIHISKPDGGFEHCQCIDTNRSTNRQQRISRRGAARLRLPPEAKKFGELEISTFFCLSGLSGKGSTISKSISKTHTFLEMTLETSGRAGVSIRSLSMLLALWNIPRKGFPVPPPPTGAGSLKPSVRKTLLRTRAYWCNQRGGLAVAVASRIYAESGNGFCSHDIVAAREVRSVTIECRWLRQKRAGSTESD